MFEGDGLTEQERLEIMNAKQVIKDTINPNNLNKTVWGLKKLMNEKEDQKISLEEKMYTDQIVCKFK